eukprot:Pgem_evm1s9439
MFIYQSGLNESLLKNRVRMFSEADIEVLQRQPTAREIGVVVRDKNSVRINGAACDLYYYSNDSKNVFAIDTKNPNNV